MVDNITVLSYLRCIKKLSKPADLGLKLLHYVPPKYLNIQTLSVSLLA